MLQAAGHDAGQADASACHAHGHVVAVAVAQAVALSVVRGVGIVRGAALAGICRFRGTWTCCGQGATGVRERERDGEREGEGRG